MKRLPPTGLLRGRKVQIVIGILGLLTAMELVHLLVSLPGWAPFRPKSPPVEGSSPSRRELPQIPSLTGTTTSPDWSDNEDVVVRGLGARSEGAEVVAQIGVEMKLLADMEEQRRNVHFIVARDSTINLVFADGTAQSVPVVRVQGTRTVEEVFLTRGQGEHASAVWPTMWPPGAQLSPAGLNVITLWGVTPVELQGKPLARVQLSLRALTRAVLRKFEKQGGSTVPMSQLARSVSAFLVETKVESR